MKTQHLKLKPDGTSELVTNLTDAKPTDRILTYTVSGNPLVWKRRRLEVKP